MDYDWYKANPERRRELKREQRRAARKRFIEARNKIRPSKCEVCGIEGAMVFDHCHVKNEFRGWLCNGCNSALGFAKDSPEILRKLAEYLEQRRTT